MTYCHQKQQHIKSKSKNLRITQSSLGTWYASWASCVAVSMLKIMSFTCEGKVITLGASPPLPFSLRWCGWPWPIRFNQWRNRTTPKQTNRHSTYKGMQKKCNNGKSHVPNMKKGKPPAPTFWMKNLAKSCLSRSFQAIWAICIHFFV